MRRRSVRTTNTPQFRGFCRIAKFLRFPEKGVVPASQIRFHARLVVLSRV
jgi:hypothetical protein